MRFFQQRREVDWKRERSPFWTDGLSFASVKHIVILDASNTLTYWNREIIKEFQRLYGNMEIVAYENENEIGAEPHETNKPQKLFAQLASSIIKSADDSEDLSNLKCALPEITANIEGAITEKLSQLNVMNLTEATIKMIIEVETMKSDTETMKDTLRFYESEYPKHQKELEDLKERENIVDRQLSRRQQKYGDLLDDINHTCHRRKLRATESIEADIEDSQRTSAK